MLSIEECSKLQRCQLCNRFIHKSGIHIDGIYYHTKCYQRYLLSYICWWDPF